MKGLKIGGNEAGIFAGTANATSRVTAPTAARRQDGRSRKRLVPEGGLALDDFLGEIELERRHFQLHALHFELKVVESFPKATAAIETLVTETVNWHRGRLSAKRCSLLAELGTKTNGKPIRTAAYSGYKISPASVEPVLRKALELGLQTIVELPSRDPKPEYSSKRVLSLAAALIKLGERVSKTTHERELLERFQLCFADSRADLMRILQLGEEMERAGKTLQTVVKRKIVRIRTGSPNPQIRFAMYLANWVTACTGQPHYALLETLISAAFEAAGKTPPKWIERLGIEMFSQRRHGQRWIRAISV